MRMLFGIKSANEVWQCTMEDEFDAVEGVGINVDDLYAPSVHI